jgi:hypothetical protein
MLRYLLILIFPLLRVSTTNGQANTTENYLCYSTLIKSEILETTRSVVIVSRLQVDSSLISWLSGAIKSKQPQQIEDIRFITFDDKGERITTSLDTATLQVILDFCESPQSPGELENFFTLNVPIIMTSTFPIQTSAQKNWDRFYRKYPKSGGIFQFSPVFYSKDGITAVFYHALSRNGLNAHDALTVMDRSTGTWKVKYHITYSQA